MYDIQRFTKTAISGACAAFFLAACGGGSGSADGTLTAAETSAAATSVVGASAGADATAVSPAAGTTAPVPAPEATTASAGDASATSGNSTPTTAPTPAPAPGPLAANWTSCASEDQVCSFSGTREVRYGLNGVYATRVASGSISCSNDVFGDPLIGVNKTCEYAAVATASATMPAPAPAPAPTPAPAPAPATSQSAAGPYGQNAADYVLTFSDEFEGNGLDWSKWNDTTWDRPGNPTINYAVEDGSLKIWPQRDASGNFFGRVIDTDGKFYQSYGYYEIEAKLPVGKGTWPAFWLYNHDEPDPFRPEIDIMEAYAGGGPASGWSDANFHPTTYAPTIWTGWPGELGGTKMVQDLGDLSAGYHKYALKWEPGKQTYYFDGREVYTVNLSMPRRMYVMLDLLFGSASGQPDDTTPQGKTNSFDVKYVRVWQFK